MLYQAGTAPRTLESSQNALNAPSSRPLISRVARGLTAQGRERVSVLLTDRAYFDSAAHSLTYEVTITRDEQLLVNGTPVMDDTRAEFWAGLGARAARRTARCSDCGTPGSAICDVCLEARR
ncbi:hypothetical protein [Deinococcus peraridilitoris]|uniref:Uncharacterized protein n=1 Tax=Deinococcus peraridilitoris (strain DSM 19664 / LMG 22246 / CIP 109416 / KR-200) TaxID=937777 RepID=K9ZYX1_DEIPD|nr:hypothetical protein [Deinococcus peraridilitoris]AFZ66097.1 hypothetical protein Deipe_0501 [Deinococcus peraridilitoris DSM 19664]